MAYPKYLHGPDATFRIVTTEAEEQAAIAAGFWVWTKETHGSAAYAVTDTAPPEVTQTENDTVTVTPKKRGRPRKSEEQP